MGSFPSILEFDSLGQHKHLIVHFIYINKLWQINTILFLFVLHYDFSKSYKQLKKKTFVKLPKSNISRIPMCVECNFIWFSCNFKNSLKKIQILLYTLFKNSYNIVIVDVNYNYNYLPITNKEIFSHKPHKNLKKLLKYFNVGCVVFFDCGFKKKAIKKVFLKSPKPKQWS